VSAPSLVQGRPGVLTVTVRNFGGTAARGLTARVNLPPGIVFRGPGGIPGALLPPDVPAADPESFYAAPWKCDRAGLDVACTLSELAAGTTSSLRVLVFVATTATSGQASGTVTGDGIQATIPPSPLAVKSR
jgi:hypothetical protein